MLYQYTSLDKKMYVRAQNLEAQIGLGLGLGLVGHGSRFPVGGYGCYILSVLYCLMTDRDISTQEVPIRTFLAWLLVPIRTFLTWWNLWH